MDKNDQVRIKYTQAKSNLQKLNRYEENLKNIKLNCELMCSNIEDRNKVFSTLRNLRRERSKPVTKLLKIPVGDYHGHDVLEGFAADAEYLGRATTN